MAGSLQDNHIRFLFEARGASAVKKDLEDFRRKQAEISKANIRAAIEAKNLQLARAGSGPLQGEELKGFINKRFVAEQRRELKAMQSELGVTKKEAQGLLSTFSRFERITILGGALLGGIAAASLAFQQLSRVASAPIKAFAEQEKSTAKLAIALGSVGEFSERAVRDLERFAQGIQNATGISNTAVQDLSSILIQLGGVGTDRIKEATQATIDFATVIGVDFKAAGLLFAKAASGDFGSLSRYGIILDQTIPKQEKFDALLKLTAEKFGGSALRQAQTFQGAVDRMRSTWSDFLKVIGQTATVFQPALEVISRGLSKINARFLEVNLGAFTAKEGLGEARKELERFIRLQEEANRTGGRRGRIRGEAAPQPFDEADANRQLGAFLDRLESIRPQISFDIRQGSREQRQQILAELEQLAEEAAATGQRRAVEAVAAVQQFAGQEQVVRAKLDADEAVTELNNLRALATQDLELTARVNIVDDKLKDLLNRLQEPIDGTVEFGATGLGAIFADADEIRQSLEDARQDATRDPIQVDVDLVLGRTPEAQIDAAIKQFQDNAAADKAGIKLKAAIEAFVPNATAAQLEKLAESVGSTFRQKAEEGLTQGIEASLEQARRLAPVLELFLPQGPVQARAQILVDQQGVQALESIRDNVQRINREAAGGIGIISAAEIQKTKDVGEALKALRTDLDAFFGVASADVQVRTVNTLLEQLEDLKVSIPSRAKEFQAFINFLRGEAVTLRIGTTVETEAATAEAKALADLIVSIQRQTGAPSVEIVRTRQLAQDSQNLDALRARLRETREELEKTGDAGKAFATFEQSQRFLEGFADSGRRLSTETRRDVEDTSAASVELLERWRDLESLPDLQKEFNLAIRENDIESARTLLRQLRELSQLVPESIEVQLLVAGAERNLASLEKRTAKTAKAVNDDLGAAFKDIGVDSLSNVLAAPLASMLDQTRSFSEAFQGIISSAVNAVAKKLATLAAVRIFESFLGVPGLSDVVNATGKPTLPPGGTQSQKPTPEPTGAPSKAVAGLGALRQPLDLGKLLADIRPERIGVPFQVEAVRQTVVPELVVRDAIDVTDFLPTPQPAAGGGVTVNVNANDTGSVARSFKRGALNRALDREIRYGG